MPNDFNQQVIDEFRANGGVVGGPFEGGRLLLLTTTGARTGVRHTTPLGYLPDGDGRVLVIASAGGAPRDPQWFRNLVTHPRVAVEAGVFRYEAEAEVLTGDERDRAFARAVESDPGWSDYQSRTDRVIPVVALREMPGPPDIAAPSFGAAVKAVHDGFRRELSLIRREFARPWDPGSTSLGAQLRVNCLTACQGLHNHHTGEDAGLFPALAARHPELAPVLERLGQEHLKLAKLLEELRAAVTDGHPDPVPVRAEVERLAAAIDEHFRYEEEHLIPVLDAASP
ncbi:nitroreductase/quinone reductase family protein [Streptomyces sp. SCSIO 30461]|uniref:nitroreductase/quinone reductase family protein n=1 Tax=Streptomyces sp. SCSIO 30461 TaxID=3118085 RepID=UPI0030D22B38